MSEIKIYARFRPLPKKASKHKQLSIDDGGIVRISIGDKQTEKFSGNPYSEYLFKFNQVFDENATQQQVFDSVVVEMIDRFLEGFNGTLFAYGQTASGKTYTIEGGARQFDERGIIPRTISYIYSVIESHKKRATEEEGQDLTTIHISYLEIYQDTGYDLLNPGNRNEGMMLNLPKVSVMESPNDEAVYIRHLSSHLASNEEMALSLLFQGSTCRKVAETTMNMSSSRSHTIFTITLTTQKQGSEVRIRSKLNLVDLAGSERVYKTCATGQILQEAKHINLSLHYLEHVIVVLQKHALANKLTGSQPVTPSCSTNSAVSNHDHRHLKTASGDRTTAASRFVPYRNSLLTMVLKDSLGGNCITAMIANLSLDKNNLMETLSTCRFSQRVACISNKARRNEELNNEVLIRRLKEKVTILQQELKELKSSETTIVDSSRLEMPLTDEQKKRCHKILYNFLHGRISDPVAEGINSPLLFTEALAVMKDVITQTIKENKKYQQKVSMKQMVDKSIQVSAINADCPNVQSPYAIISSSTSPQSQISSGFVSLKDDDDLHNSHCSFEKQKKVINSISEQNTISHSNKVKMPLKEPRSHLTHQKSSKQVVDSKPPAQVTEMEYKKSSPVPVLLPPTKEMSIELVKKERQDLIKKVNSLNREMLRNSMRLDLESVTAKLAIQQAKVVRMQQMGANFDEIITEKKIQQQLQLKMDRVSTKLEEMKNDSTADSSGKQTYHDSIGIKNNSNHQQKINEEIQDLRLEKLQKQLELKEAATMRRLIALKSEMQSDGGDGPKSIFALNTKENNAKGKQDHSSYTENRRESIIKHSVIRTSEGETNNKREQSSVVSIQAEQHCEPSRRSSLYRLQSPQSSEKLYSKELLRHKTRVTQIRQCMKAAVTIQRAWRRYKKKANW